MATYVGDDPRGRAAWTNTGRQPTSAEARAILGLRDSPEFQAELRNQANQYNGGALPTNSYTLARDAINGTGIWNQDNQAPPYTPGAPRLNPTSGGSSGGGGGGGGAAKPTLGQGELDWITSLFRNRPQNQTANTLTSPTYQNYTPRAFDPSQYNQLRARLGQAGQQDTATANQAYDRLDQTLNSNYKNAFAQLPQGGGAGGMDQQAMQRFLSQQGVDPSNMQGAQQQQGQANQAFGNLWNTLSAGETMAQQGRLATSQLGRQDVLANLRAALLGGNTGIDMQQGAAQTAWQQRADDFARQDWQAQQDRAQQDAIANWQRQNQVGDANLQGQNQWDQSTIQALLGLLPDLAGLGLNLPDMQALLGRQAA